MIKRVHQTGDSKWQNRQIPELARYFISQHNYILGYFRLLPWLQPKHLVTNALFLEHLL
jgi:hypothetical protein